MGSQIVGVFTTGSGNFTTVDYTADIQIINTNLNSIALGIADLNTFLLSNFSNGAAGLPQTMAASGLVQARALNLIATILSQNLATGSETNGSISSLNTSLAAIAASLGDIGASANISLAQTMEKNAFEMQAANTAREEAGLPKVEVSHQTMSEKIKGTAATAVDVAAMTNTAGLVQSGINRATGAAGNLVTEYITAPAGGYIASAWSSTKQFFGADPEKPTLKATVTTKVAANDVLTGG